MALVKCKECGHTVSTQAPACPHCGVPPRQQSGGCGSSLVVIAIIIIAVWCFLAPEGSLQRLLSSSHNSGETTDSSGTSESSAAKARAADSTPVTTPDAAKPIDFSNPVDVANAYVAGLTQEGTVKQSKYLGSHPGGARGLVTCIYYMDYLTRSGLRREGQYNIVLERRPDGTYHILSEGAAQ